MQIPLLFRRSGQAAHICRLPKPCNGPGIRREGRAPREDPGTDDLPAHCTGPMVVPSSSPAWMLLPIRSSKKPIMTAAPPA